MGRGKRKPKKRPCATIEGLEDKNLAQESAIKGIAKNVVDISSRLSLPVIRNWQIESDDDTDDEETIEFDFRPRKVFLSNTCLVCSRICSPEYLCENCEMVSYCTDDHRRDDAASHRELCEALRKYYRDVKSGSSASPEEYRIFRVGVIEGTERLLKRCLQLWEKEIVLYPRACFKCHRGNETRDLKCCQDCRVVFWCGNENAESHYEWCLQYKIFRKLVAAQAAHGNTEPRIPSVYFEAPVLSANNFDTVMAMVNNNSSNFRDMDIYNYTTLSHLASIPLTALYAVQELRRDWRSAENFAVHLVGAEFQYEGINLRVWEKLFLHFLPRLKNLELVITGPELFLPQVPRELLTRVKICPRCKSGGKRIGVSFVPRTLYHDYASSTDYRKPDLACLFNPGLYRRTGFDGRDTWPNTISELCRAKVPILVTAYTEREIPMDIKRIESVCDVEVVLTPRRNPFASLRPDRNFVSDESVPLIYKNYFLSIVRAP